MNSKHPLQPLVSIGMPSYNRAKMLPAALRALCAQTYKNIEIIVTNNGSSDNTIEVLKKWQKRDPRIRIIHHPRHIPAIANFNSSLAIARGEYFGWVSDDDTFAPTYVAELLAVHQRHPTTLLATPKFQVMDQYHVIQPHQRSFCQLPNDTVLTLEMLLSEPMTGYKANVFYGVYKTATLLGIGGYRHLAALAASDLSTVYMIAALGEIRLCNNILLTKQELFVHPHPPRHTHLSKLRPLIPRLRACMHLLHPICGPYLLFNTFIYWKETERIIQLVSPERRTKLRWYNLRASWQLLWSLLPNDWRMLRARNKRFSG